MVGVWGAPGVGTALEPRAVAPHAKPNGVMRAIMTPEAEGNMTGFTGGR